MSRAAAALALFTAAAAFGASPVTTYTSVRINSATSVNVDPAPDDLTSPTGAPVQLSDTGSANYAFTNGTGGFTVKPTSDDVFAHASLAAGQLKTRASLAFGTNAFVSGAPMPVGTRNGSASATAVFADHFSTVTGGGTPFLWTAGDHATFRFAVTGSATFAGTIPDPVSRDPGQPIDEIITSLQFTAFTPGGLDLLDRLNHFDFETHTIDEYLALNDQLEASIIPGSNKIWTLGPSIVPYDLDPAMVLAIDPVTPTEATFSFNPQGDFEWLLRLDSTVFLDASLQNVSAAFDFSHTIATTYEPPAGATTLSSSGLFPGTVPAPEPGSVALLLLAVPLAAAGRRRRR